MKDAIGQEIRVGDLVCHCGGSYASASILKVAKITEKHVSFDIEAYPGRSARRVSLHPSTLVVVTDNLKMVSGELVAVTADVLAELSKSKCFLECLEAAGVDNWDGYSYAMQEYREEYP